MILELRISMHSIRCLSPQSTCHMGEKNPLVTRVSPIGDNKIEYTLQRELVLNVPLNREGKFCLGASNVITQGEWCSHCMWNLISVDAPFELSWY